VRKLPVANPPNRFHSSAVDYECGEAPNAELTVLIDSTRNILAKNTSPDVGFDFSVNPYRGCLHGCAYCYARPSHEYLGLGAGTDFERTIVIKPNAADLLREAFEKKSWHGDTVVFSGVTDCYQPLEAEHRLTRQCLEVCLDYKNPVGIITKAPLVERDIDLLVELNKVTRVSVTISIPFWNKEIARAIEPYVASPERRIHTIEKLASAGIRVGVSAAPLIPGLAEEEFPYVLKAARAAGATYAFYVLLRLPGAVKPVFEARIREALPLRAEKILKRLTEAHDGKVYRSDFGTRQRGTGVYATMIESLFKKTARQLGYEADESNAMPRGYAPELDSPTFERPKERVQLKLF